MLSFVQLRSGCWMRPQPQELLLLHGKVPGSFAGSSWSSKKICLASSALISINRAPVFWGGEQGVDQTAAGPHLGDNCKVGAGSSLVPSTHMAPPAGGCWNPPSPHFLTLCGWTRVQRVPKKGCTGWAPAGCSPARGDAPFSREPGQDFSF